MFNRNLFVKKSAGEVVLDAVVTTLSATLIGGVALMLLSSMILPVGFGYWAAAAMVFLGRIVHAALTMESDK